MGHGNTGSDQSQRPHATAGATRSAVAWIGWTVALVAAVAFVVIVGPAVLLYCLLFDVD